MNLHFFKTHEKAYIPEYATGQASCFDIRASLPENSSVIFYSPSNQKIVALIATGVITIPPGHRALIPTNLIIDIPEGFSVRVHPRSGLALKQGLTLINCEGVIDSDYVDPFFVTIVNTSSVDASISDGDRLAQGELIKDIKVSLGETFVKPLQKTDRNGGFGSTGVA